MSPALNSDHIHLLHRIKKSKQYRCMHPDCSYIATRDIIKGKRALCPICRNTYILEGRLLELAKPHCNNCTRSTKQEKLNKLQEAIDDTLEDII